MSYDLQTLIGSDTWLCIERHCLFNTIRDATLAHLIETGYINVRVSRYFTIQQYWQAYPVSLGLPDDPKVFNIFWTTVCYDLTCVKESLLIDYIRATLLALPPLVYSRLGSGVDQRIPVTRYAPKIPVVTESIREESGYADLNIAMY